MSKWLVIRHIPCADAPNPSTHTQAFGDMQQARKVKLDPIHKKVKCKEPLKSGSEVWRKYLTFPSYSLPENRKLWSFSPSLSKKNEE